LPFVLGIEGEMFEDVGWLCQVKLEWVRNNCKFQLEIVFVVQLRLLNATALGKAISECNN
jgi:hypothetical protein